jgi:hypothetical protein
MLVLSTRMQCPERLLGCEQAIVSFAPPNHFEASRPVTLAGYSMRQGSSSAAEPP